MWEQILSGHRAPNCSFCTWGLGRDAHWSGRAGHVSGRAAGTRHKGHDAWSESWPACQYQSCRESHGAGEGVSSGGDGSQVLCFPRLERQVWTCSLTRFSSENERGGSVKPVSMASGEQVIMMVESSRVESRSDARNNAKERTRHTFPLPQWPKLEAGKQISQGLLSHYVTHKRNINQLVR